MLDTRTLAFADYSGNRQYISLGNLADNPRAQLFLIDYGERRRVKIWGTARVVESDAKLLAKLMPEGYRARPEQAIVFDVNAWDANCPQHIPRRFEAPADIPFRDPASPLATSRPPAPRVRAWLDSRYS